MPRSIAAVALCLGLAACSRSGPALDGLHERRGGILRLASINDIRTLDTAIGYDVESWRYERLINDGLFGYGEDATLVPHLATGFPAIDNGRVLTFHLRDDVVFHHGRKVVAGDVKYAIERILEPRTISPAGSFFETIAGAKDFVAHKADHVSGLECPDDHTLRITLTQPDPAFLNVLAMPFAYPIPKELVERCTDPVTGDSTWAEHVVGCGPYRLETWNRGIRLRLARFDRYYRSDVAFLDHVEQRFGIPDFMQLMMFERGEVDVSDIPLPDFQRVRADPRLSRLCVTQPENAIFYCSMNCEMPPFTNRLVRQAFNYAVDKDRICQILSDRAVPARGVLPPGMPGYNPALRGYPHDPAKARALLAGAGYADGLEVELLTRGRAAEQRWAESIQQDLAKVGVTARLRPVAFPQWLDLSGKRRTVPFTINAWFQDYPDPSNFLDVLLNGEKITEQNANNRAFYNNPEVNRLLNQAASMTDPAARLAVYRNVEQMVVEDAPWIFVYHSVAWRLVQPWVQNYHLHPVWAGTEERVWLAPTTAPEKASR